MFQFSRKLNILTYILLTYLYTNVVGKLFSSQENLRSLKNVYFVTGFLQKTTPEKTRFFWKFPTTYSFICLYTHIHFFIYSYEAVRPVLPSGGISGHWSDLRRRISSSTLLLRRQQFRPRGWVPAPLPFGW